VPLVLDVRHRLLVPGLALATALLFGALVGLNPMLGVAFAGAVAVCLLAFLAPMTHLTVLLILTVVVPYSFQNALAAGAGLLPSDLFLLTGLLRAGVVLLRSPLDARRTLVAALFLLFLGGSFLQFIHGLRAGADLSAAGAEFRPLLSYGALVVALPMVADAAARPRLLKGLLVVGLLLGLWGIAQWGLNLSYGGAGDVGVRSGVRLTSGGSGQIQGGLYGFPVAVGLACAALMSGEIRSVRQRVLVLAALALNAAALLLTFERTFWVGALAAVALVTLRLGTRGRMRALLLMPVLALVGLGALAALAPAQLVTARERLLSLNQYGSDNSVRYRVIETQHVVAKIQDHPIVGSGLADTIFWGRPYAGVPPASYVFSHNGYLWMAWKVGIPLTVLLCLLIGLPILWRGPPQGDRLYAAVRAGCQAGLFALLVICIFWPDVRILSITPAIGVFIAVAATPRTTVGHPVSERSSAT